MKILKVTLALALIGSMTTGFAQNMDMAKNTAKASSEAWSNDVPTIAGVASQNENFSTLVTALKAAGLVSTLDGDRAYTVFAPTNAAFEKLPDGTVTSLLKSENKPTLTKILTYHVVAGEYKASDVVKAIKDNSNAFPIETVAGEKITLSLKDGSVILTDVTGNTSTVTATDVEASNGVIHVIDTVVMPQ